MKTKTVGWSYLIMGGVLTCLSMWSKSVSSENIPYGIIIGGIGFILIRTKKDLED